MRNADASVAMLPISSSSTESARRGFAGSISHWLHLAAAPAFLLMAVASTLFAPPEMICSTMGQGFSLSGMVPMYLLMSLFHVPPWLKLMSGSKDPL